MSKACSVGSDSILLVVVNQMAMKTSTDIQATNVPFLSIPSTMECVPRDFSYFAKNVLIWHISPTSFATNIGYIIPFRLLFRSVCSLIRLNLTYIPRQAKSADCYSKTPLLHTFGVRKLSAITNINATFLPRNCRMFCLQKRWYGTIHK